MEKINIKDKLEIFHEYWSPKIVGDLNDSYVKLAKFKGEFVWHKHDHEDELFFIIKGELLIKFRDGDVYLKEGEFIIIPKGVEHLPIAKNEVQVMLIEPKVTLNTGNTQNSLTKDILDRI